MTDNKFQNWTEQKKFNLMFNPLIPHVLYSILLSCHSYILLDVLLCSIAVYSYELCRILMSP